MLENGSCIRPVEFDCAFETVCERCIQFTTAVDTPTWSPARAFPA
jgi:hypothetical protein